MERNIMKNEEKVVTNQTIVDEGMPEGMPKNITEAFNKFQDLNITALKDSSNPYFKSTYADLTSVINAVNQGTQFGLKFNQFVEFETHLVTKSREDIMKDGTKSITTAQVLERDIWVRTVVNHILLGVVECRVPVLIKGSDKDDPQKMGSAITYAKRYGLQSIYGLGQDDDGNLASGKENTNGQK
tara:strand:+ start:4467 stop:5021 length:555 start_codon:yes stop_codon:yes gene_type:complete